MSEPTRRQALHTLKAHQAQHAGLWLDKFLENQARTTPGARENAPETARDTARHRLMVEATNIPLPAGYRSFFARWETALAELPGVIRRRAQATGRVIVGLGNESPSETAITLHHTYGAPYLPGSALKGLAAFYARNFLEDAGWRATATGAPGPAYRTLFGDTTRAGCVTFYDAYYIPDSVAKDRMLHTDTITVHHPDYYQAGSAAPADWDSPTPLPFVSTNGAYLVALGGADAAWVRAGLTILGLALAELGIGAKTSSGYGRMTLTELPASAQPHSKTAAPQRTAAETPGGNGPRQRGQIKTVKDNFAFIQPEDGGSDIYVNKNVVPPGSWPLRTRQIVEFTVEPDKTPGKVRAVQVTVVG
jgi:CRISPR-associated protein Cmr6